MLLNGRLTPGMFPLLRQVQIVTDNAKGCCSRLTGAEAPVFEDGDADFAQLNQRINDTIKFVKGLKKHQFPDNADDAIEMRVPIGVLHFNCEEYVKGWTFPNFYFHLTTAYNILRHNGVEIGKADFLGMVPGMTATGKTAKMVGLPQERKKQDGKAGSKEDNEKISNVFSVNGAKSEYSKRKGAECFNLTPVILLILNNAGILS